MQPYPQELRIRVVAAVEQGEHSIPEVARLFNVGVTFVKKMLRLHHAGEDLMSRHGGGPKPFLQKPEHHILRRHIAAQPDASLFELQQVLADQHEISVSQTTICRTLQELDLPRKKSPFAQERNEKQRKEFRCLTDKLDSDQFVFVDEMGSHLAMTQLYARAAPGERVMDKVLVRMQAYHFRRIFYV